MSKNKKLRKTPPKEAIQSIQYDLFTTFLTNDGGSVSNAVEVWDAIPKYFLTPVQQKNLRSSNGLAKPFEWEYVFNSQPCSVSIQPALIKQGDGEYKAFFPSVTEELVEEALKKIFTDQHYGIHDPDNTESWVRFTLGMISRELKERGRERNRPEIKHAIAVLSRCVLTLYQDGKEVYSGPILSDLVTVNRSEYLADSDSQHVARLPVFLSHGINRRQYRQFNYSRWMEFDSQLSRWLFKRLVHRYRHASLIDTYHFMYSDVKQNSGLLQQGREADNRKKVIGALEELKNKRVILSYEAGETRHARRVTNVKYTLTAAPEFIKEQKAANKRAAALVDKSA
jgi:hypothetical protein